MVEDDDPQVDFQTVLKLARIEMDDGEYRRKFRLLDFMQFSPKQKAALNSSASALYLKTNNQFGKTTVAAAMVVFHALQEYPPWYGGWKPPKLDLIRPHSFVAWALAPNTLLCRDGLQAKICGDYASGALGQGLLPAEAVRSVQISRGISGALDTIVCTRADGTTAAIRFKSYEMSREALQSETCDFIVADELPDEMGIWNELNARLSATSGRIWLTATPRRQQSPVAAWFKEPSHPERETITATIDDTTHFTAAQRQEMKDRYANDPAEAATRLYGSDFAGGGQILTTPMHVYVEDRDPNDFPMHTKYIIGIDPSRGGTSAAASKSAAVLCAVDDYARRIHVIDCIRMLAPLPESFVAAILQWDCADQIPVAWGSAENAPGLGGKANESYAAMFRRLGLRCLPSHSVLEGGSVALAPQIDLLNHMMATGRLKVNRRCADLLEEIASWEYDEKGAVIARRDDIIASLRYAVMSSKSAKAVDPDAPRRGLGPRRRRGGPARIAEGVSRDAYSDALFGGSEPEWGA